MLWGLIFKYKTVYKNVKLSMVHTFDGFFVLFSDSIQLLILCIHDNIEDSYFHRKLCIFLWFIVFDIKFHFLNSDFIYKSFILKHEIDSCI